MQQLTALVETIHNQIQQISSSSGASEAQKLLSGTAVAEDVQLRGFLPLQPCHEKLSFDQPQAPGQVGPALSTTPTHLECLMSCSLNLCTPVSCSTSHCTCLQTTSTAHLLLTAACCRAYSSMQASWTSSSIVLRKLHGSTHIFLCVFCVSKACPCQDCQICIHAAVHDKFGCIVSHAVAWGVEGHARMQCSCGCAKIISSAATHCRQLHQPWSAAFRM